MDDDRNVGGCLFKFIQSAFKLFVPVALLMGVAIIGGYFVESATNSSFCGFVFLAIIPLAIAYSKFSKMFRGRKE